MGLARPSPSSARCLACWVTQAESGCAVDALTLDPPAPELDEHEDVEGAEPGGLDGAEVTGDDAICLGSEELGPGWATAPRGGTESGGPEQGPDRRRAHPEAELPARSGRSPNGGSPGRAGG